MIIDELEVKVIKIVKEPKMSLKRFSQYMVATEVGKKRIIEKSKYPGGYIPKFYEMARKVICDVFSANFEDFDVYFDEFKRQASTFKKDAIKYPSNKDPHKNRMCSASGLEQIIAMSIQLSPILTNYTLNSNLTQRKDSITKNGLKIGAMADMLLFENAGATQVGFLKFNFTKKALTKQEAITTISVLKAFFEKKGVKLDLSACFLIDAFAWRVYTASHQPDIKDSLNKACIEIVQAWDLI